MKRAPYSQHSTIEALPFSVCCFLFCPINTVGFLHMWHCSRIYSVCLCYCVFKCSVLVQVCVCVCVSWSPYQAFGTHHSALRLKLGDSNLFLLLCLRASAVPCSEELNKWMASMCHYWHWGYRQHRNPQDLMESLTALLPPVTHVRDEWD